MKPRVWTREEDFILLREYTEKGPHILAAADKIDYIAGWRPKR
jgi:hypothetical protein